MTCKICNNKGIIMNSQNTRLAIKKKKKKKMEHNLLVEIIKSHYHLEKMRQIYQTIVLNQIRDLLTWRENCQGILNSDKIT